MTAHNVYLAHPIDQDDDPGAAGGWHKDLREVKAFLESREDVGWIFDPQDAFSLGSGSRSAGLQAINHEALRQSNVVLGWLPKGVATIGTPIEIDRALQAGIPTRVATSVSSWALCYPAPYPLRTAGEMLLGLAQFLDWARETRKGISEPLGANEGTRMPYVVSEGSEGPRKGYDDDAGLDLVVSENVTVGPGEFVDISCGVSVQLPDWAWGLITGRSSTLRKRGLLVSQGVIDAGYRGPLFAGVWNLTEQPVLVREGERIAQLIVHRREPVELVRVAELAPSLRGTKGFGSSGT